jgi:hypothetical protein
MEKLNKPEGVSGEGWEIEWKTLQQGTATHVYASFSPDIVGQNGSYLLDCHVGKGSEVGNMENAKEDAAKLWALGEKLVSQT